MHETKMYDAHMRDGHMAKGSTVSGQLSCKLKYRSACSLSGCSAENGQTHETFIFQQTKYPCNNTYDIFFLIYYEYF